MAGQQRPVGSAGAMAGDEEEIERVESFRTNPRVDSFSQYPRGPSESFNTVVPDQGSFNTIVPDRQSFNTIVPDKQSFNTLPAVDSFSAYSQGSHRTLVPDKRSFQTLPGTGSRSESFHEHAHQEAPRPSPAHKAGDVALYQDSLEAQARTQQGKAPRSIETRAMHGSAKVAPSRPGR